MEWQGYFYIENLGLNQQQKQTLVDTLKAWGLHNDAPNPRDRNHWRARLDNEAVIFEAIFEADHLTVYYLRTRLAVIFGVHENLISFTTSQNKYGELAVFSYNNVDRLRLGVFAGRSAGYEESQLAAQQFLADFAGAWEQSEGGI
jgi:hypothetical protein